MKKLIFIELNEINFDLVKKYFQKYKFNNLKKINSKIFFTKSEKVYKLLEPWIQWFSVYTGLQANEHKIFRLGDSIKNKFPQYFEEIESAGYTVGVISAINATNKLIKPSYFVPDPWTQTRTDGSFTSSILNKLLKSTVNNNANNKVGFKNYFFLIILFLRFSRFKNYFLYIYYFFTSYKRKWRKALFLDLFLNDIHFFLFNKGKTNFSTLFLNAGAHIQHHYLFNSLANRGSIFNPEHIIKKKLDPFKECLFLYDRILNDYLNKKNFKLIIATGLTQIMCKNIKYYYRLKDHKLFLNKLGIKFTDVLPRMSRDFLIQFSSKSDRDKCYHKLNKIYLNQEKLFGVLDKRYNSLFVTLTYKNKINKNSIITFEKSFLNIFELVSFVAIKNGEHSQKGFVYMDNHLKKIINLKSNSINLIKLNFVVKKFFNIGK
jgi:hypothetical protein